MAEEKKVSLQQLREGSIGKIVNSALDKVDRFLGPNGKAWLANGLDELRQAAQPAFATQVGPGMNPGLAGTITTGEATAERMAGDRSNEAVLQSTYEIPQQKISLDEMRGQATEQTKEQGHQKDRGGHEM